MDDNYTRPNPPDRLRPAGRPYGAEMHGDVRMEGMSRCNGERSARAAAGGSRGRSERGAECVGRSELGRAITGGG